MHYNRPKDFYTIQPLPLRSEHWWWEDNTQEMKKWIFFPGK
jgi:hypothetical protein